MDHTVASYHPALVVLSLAIAAIASLTALDLAGRVKSSRGLARQLWLAGGAFAMGTGIWSMHFVGMLAMDTASRSAYNIPLTLVSLLAALLASALALATVQGGRLTWPRLTSGAIIMGTGVCLMHYIGMEAMLSITELRYRIDLFLASVAVAVVASALALTLAFRLNREGIRSPLWQRGLAALIMAVGIAGMHYTGMAATSYQRVPMAVDAGGLGNGQLAFLVALASIFIMVTALLISIYDAHLSSRNALLADSLQRANQELKDLVHQDALTQLPNRLKLEEHLDAMIATESASFAVFFVDLDRFKQVNDSLGHHAGDELIKGAAARLKSAVRDGDLVARVGGDEFMIVAGPNITHGDAEAMARRILSALDKPFQIHKSMVKVSTSLGISLHPENGRSRHDLMVHADAAMYSAKQNGRNTYQFFAPDMTHAADRRSILEQRLRHALDNDGLTLAYQPKINVHSGQVAGVEALLRWHDEELGQIAPDEAIPLAEDCGLILPLGEWVLRTACRFSCQWMEETGQALPVAVNISAIQLNHRGFVDTIKTVLTDTGLPPNLLELELTETCLVQNPDRAMEVLGTLRELGVLMSIDDFGTGYSNLTQLKNLPVDRLKIDRSFMEDIANNSQDAAIVRAVISLARSLGLHIIAEGIENSEQLAFISKLQGHEYQGYLFSKPVPAAELRRLLQERATQVLADQPLRAHGIPPDQLPA
ncbi:EAL domain-containing protein [Halomonas sp. DP8Y7-1]|uniref:putative bifunctional diguanylate cyclase/phosphodiesterase n=1 Tax=Halomonas sp. DP8Y7-1 TaxID=2859078 RepID=UPI001C97071C|nr:EAL domain-containing protein [Halomonas sp. DP8Y7-1]MBY6031500.1 EAL domain-containing protein [Halomonas sp. DP8Y7-1]